MTYATIGNVTSLITLFDYSNTVSGGWFYIMIPISVYSIMVLVMLRFEYEIIDIMMSAGFVTSLLAFFIWLMGGISGGVLFTFVAITGLSALWSMWKDNRV